jgi:glyoxylase-like metal-dependent hydrolase (beta-lactamase superfamily II)
MIKAPQQQIPGVYHHRVGDIIVTALSDGFLDGSLDVLRNISQEEARQILSDNFRPARRTAVNAFLLYSAGRLALIETGSGNYLLPTAGKLLANLKASGVDPADIEAVLLTHMHPDHSAGLTDMSSSCTRMNHAIGSTTPRWRSPVTAPKSSTFSAPVSRPRPTRTAPACSSRARCFRA